MHYTNPRLLYFTYFNVSQQILTLCYNITDLIYGVTILLTELTCI